MTDGDDCWLRASWPWRFVELLYPGNLVLFVAATSSRLGAQLTNGEVVCAPGILRFEWVCCYGGREPGEAVVGNLIMRCF